MSAINVTSITPEIAAQIGSVVAVGLAVLAVYGMRKAFKDLYSALGFGGVSDVERDAARERLAGNSVEVRDGAIYSVDRSERSVEQQAAAVKASLEGMREYERLGNVWQTWKDQSDAGPGQSRMNIKMYDALVARGMDAQDAIAAVEARNAAVSRMEARQNAIDEREHQIAIDRYQEEIDAKEHQAAIERYANASETDLTVRLGAGWK
ncbi:MAG: hypothetical protein Q7T97_11540 [Burkholderiaceae bacterium]|nr:hypothetical protein [Burkholderiaceae bacterium]